MDAALTVHERNIADDLALLRKHAGAEPGWLAGAIELQICENIEDILFFWRTLEAENTSTVYQRQDWARIALATLERGRGTRPFIVAGRLEGQPALLLPLVVKGTHYATVQWIGGSHVNLCMGLYSRNFLALSTPQDISTIMERVARLSGAHVLRLCCQPRSWNGYANPLSTLPHQPSTNPAFMMHLAGGFEALLQRGNAKRKKKKFRAQCRQAEAAGGYRFIIAQDPRTATGLLEAFFAQKGDRLRKSGIHNVFGCPKAREMLSTLALSSIGTDEPLLRLHGLEIGGKIRAVFGGGIKQKHLSGYFSSIADDEMAEISPGEMLLYLLTEHYCAEGLKTMDLGSGDERYKRSWCDEKHDLFDVIMPASAAGIPLAAIEKLGYRLRRKLRQTPRVWNAIIAARRARAQLFWR